LSAIVALLLAMAMAMAMVKEEVNHSKRKFNTGSKTDFYMKSRVSHGLITTDPLFWGGANEAKSRTILMVHQTIKAFKKRPRFAQLG
jgi:hypothetical protein